MKAALCQGLPNHSRNNFGDHLKESHSQFWGETGYTSNCLLLQIEHRRELNVCHLMCHQLLNSCAIWCNNLCENHGCGCGSAIPSNRVVIKCNSHFRSWSSDHLTLILTAYYLFITVQSWWTGLPANPEVPGALASSQPDEDEEGAPPSPPPCEKTLLASCHDLLSRECQRWHSVTGHELVVCCWSWWISAHKHTLFAYNHRWLCPR